MWDIQVYKGVKEGPFRGILANLGVKVLDL